MSSLLYVFSYCFIALCIPPCSSLVIPEVIRYVVRSLFRYSYSDFFLVFQLVVL